MDKAPIEQDKRMVYPDSIIAIVGAVYPTRPKWKTTIMNNKPAKYSPTEGFKFFVFWMYAPKNTITADNATCVKIKGIDKELILIDVFC